ncbi:MAG: glycerol-3-phosphate dehydrogenase/oxidase [Deltaproteobacteria bacterium]|nr:MAG: glycerol-3-phosphate dehydrogenase/oxidase [Deltaproteobacteria bacterium]
MSERSIQTTGRSAAIDRLEREVFDCVVIGGGITGAGIARAAGLRGLRAALLEADDFSIGTSSRSSKLIHGGLRYLAMGDVLLVRSAALERKVIHRLAPHLAEPRWMVVPVGTRAGLAKVRVGIATYEKLGSVEKPDLHSNWSREDLEREEPLIDRERYPYACAYREYLTDDTRLVLANLRAAAGNGNEVLNRARVDAIATEQGRAAGVEAVCGVSGRRFHVRARAVINAAGPWVDAVRRLEAPDAPAMLHLSKGVHIVLRAEQLPVRNMLVLGTRDKRSIFAIRRGPVTFVGTTDTTYAPGSQVWPEIDLEDVEYLLAPLKRYLSAPELAPRDVVAAWAGLRPLIAQPGKPPTEISRRDEVLVGPHGVVTIAGGKLTGYRPMARTALEKAAEVCGLALAPEPDEEPPLPGGDFDGDLDALAQRVSRDTGRSASSAARLVRLYGSEAFDVVGMGPEPLVPGCELLAGEVDWAVAREGAVSVEDVVYRRSRTALYEPEERETVLEPIGTRMAAALGWSAEQTALHVAEARARMSAELGFERQGAAA